MNLAANLKPGFDVEFGCLFFNFLIQESKEAMQCVLLYDFGWAGNWNQGFNGFPAKGCAQLGTVNILVPYSEIYYIR